MDFLKSVSDGFFSYQSYIKSRILFAGWEDQKPICIINQTANIANFITISLSNVEFLWGKPFASRFKKIEYASFFFMPGLYLLTKRLEGSQVNEAEFLKWEQKFPKNGDDDVRTLGERIEGSTDGVRGRRWFAKKYPRHGEEDASSLAQRIDEAHAQSKRSSLEKTFHNAVNFTCMHIPDLLLIISTVQAVAAIYFGFNQVDNLIYILFCALAVLEQGVFWMKPEENSGPLFNIKDGAIVRAYKPIMNRIDSATSIFFDFIYGRIIGKIIATLCLITCRYSVGIISRIINRYFADFSTRNYSGVLPTPENIEDREVENLQLAPTKKLFESFQIEDQFPEKTLENMKDSIQELLRNDTTQFMDEVKNAEKPINNREKLEFFLGEDGKFYTYKTNTNSDEETKYKEIEMKNILGRLLEDWDNLKSHIAGCYDDWNCITAQQSVINNLHLEIYPALIKNIPIQLDNKLSLKNVLEAKILLILQSFRDREFDREIQSLPEKVEEINSNLSTGLFMIVSLYLKLLEYCVTNHHQVSFLKYLMGRDIGLSSYQNTWRDIQKTLSNAGIDIQNIDFLIDNTPISIYNRTHTQMIFLRLPWLDEIKEVILNDSDIRLDYEEIRDYMFLRAEDFGKENNLRNECLAFEEYKPIYSDNTFIGNFDLYNKGRKYFLDKYLNQVLFDIGLLAKPED